MTARVERSPFPSAAMPLPHHPGLSAGLALAADGAVIAFLVGTSGAFFWTGLANLERYFWLVADAALLIWAMRRPDRLLAGARQCKVFVAWALLALGSAAWSLSPWTSFYHGIQLLLTVLFGILLGVQGGGLRLLRQVFVALSICQVFSLVAVAFKPHLAIGVGGEWSGAFHHKNTLGAGMALQVVTGLILILAGWRRIPVLIATLTAALLLLRSSSGASIVVLAVAVAPLPLALTFRNSPRLAGLVLGSAIMALSVALAIVALSGTDLTQMLLGRLGKDATLTGRTILWHFGLDAFAERPLLGHGYRGFWEGSTAAVFHLRNAIGQELWHFHNNGIEALVAFGVIGPVALLAGLAVAVTRTLRVHLATGAWGPFWALQVVIAVAVSSLAENVLIVNHGFHQVLLVAALVATTSPSVIEMRR